MQRVRANFGRLIFVCMPLFKLYLADVSSALPLQYADAGVRAGFPSPAQDYISATIDLNKELIQHPASTFYARVEGDSMSGEGITEGDILVIDKSIEPEEGDLAVCCLDGEFTQTSAFRFGQPHIPHAVEPPLPPD